MDHLSSPISCNHRRLRLKWIVDQVSTFILLLIVYVSRITIWDRTHLFLQSVGQSIGQAHPFGASFWLG